MASTVLLYGADEFIGGLVARKARSSWNGPGAPNLVLAGTRWPWLAALGADLGLPAQAFDWRDAATLAAEVAKADVIVNAATPFEETAMVIAAAAVKAGRAYLDLNSEIDVERKLVGLAAAATQANATVVCGAGPGAVVSGLMVRAAMTQLYAQGVIAAGDPVGTIRVAMSCFPSISRSSAASAWRALASAVAVGAVLPGPIVNPGLGVQYQSVPIGQLARAFDFSSATKTLPPRICVGASVADSHAAGWTGVCQKHQVNRIETYVQSTRASRILYPLGAGLRAWLAPAYTFDIAKEATRLAFEAWPPGPPAGLRDLEPFEIVLQIEDQFMTPVVDWRLTGPNLYDMVSQLSAAMALRLAAGAPPGCLTPADLLVAPMTGATPIADLPGVKLYRKLLA